MWELFSRNPYSMQKYVCTGCYGVYDPLIGDEDTGIAQGTPFDEISEDWSCPVCLAPKDAFLLLPENIQEADDPENILPKESEHIPRYVEVENLVYVRLSEGDEDIDFPATEEHHLTSVGLFDDEGEPIEWKIIDRENPEAWYVFDRPDDGYQVRADCNLHGTWKGIFDESLIETIPEKLKKPTL
jgi:rubredoxin/desulfoferrodoxin (superoxide reductase-like protein)